jgi:hypothetical protein
LTAKWPLRDTEVWPARHSQVAAKMAGRKGYLPGHPTSLEERETDTDGRCTNGGWRAGCIGAGHEKQTRLPAHKRSSIGSLPSLRCAPRGVLHHAGRPIHNFSRRSIRGAPGRGVPVIPLRPYLVLAVLSFVLGLLIGCGDVTANMVEAPPAAPPDAGDTVSRPDVGSRQGADAFVPTSDSDGAAAAGGEAATIPDAGATPEASAAAEVAPEHFPHCQGASSDYRLTVCKPGCGTCGKMGEASTYIAGCWTSDDFHCVDSCAGCR